MADFFSDGTVTSVVQHNGIYILYFKWMKCKWAFRSMKRFPRFWTTVRERIYTCREPPDSFGIGRPTGLACPCAPTKSSIIQELEHTSGSHYRYRDVNANASYEETALRLIGFSDLPGFYTALTLF